MATKDRCLSNGDKQKGFGGNSFSNDSTQFTNLNLNQNHKCLEIVSVHSESIKSSRSNKNNALIKTLDFKTDNNNESDSKKDFISLNKGFNYSKTSEYLNLYDSEEEKKHKKKRKRSSSDSSTLSLHIAAYENSESVADKDGVVESTKNHKLYGNKVWKGVKQLFNGSESIIQNPFEFPRQQEDKDKMEPEIMQFKASQKLLNPNESNSTTPNTATKMDKQIENLSESQSGSNTPKYPVYPSLASSTDQSMIPQTGFSGGGGGGYGFGSRYRQRESQEIFSDPKMKEFVDSWKKEIDEFYRGPLKEFTLPIMSKDQRRYLHKLVRDKDLRSFSKGQEGSRYLTITKVSAYKYATVPVNEAHPLRLQKEQLDLIKEYLTAFPIDEEQVLKHYEDPGISARKHNAGHSMIYNDMLVPSPPNIHVAPFITAFRKTLPAYHMKSEIMETIRNYQIIMVTGGTGCGKTTQVPQFVLEEAAATQQKVRIICTQPRRLPAIAVAERVAKERGEEFPGTVGYHIRLEQKTKYETVLTYCTSGVLSRLLTIDAIAKNVSHIILDEIHEREQNTDYLLIALREALHVRKDLKVILMSATMEGNRETFLRYFEKHSIGVVDIPSRLHNVDKFFLGDVLAMTSYLSGNPDAAPVTGAFPQVEQWAHDRSGATVGMPMQPCNTAPDLNQYGYLHSIHPSASTPSLQITDPIEQIATQITSSQSFVRQSSLYNDPIAAPYSAVIPTVAYENYAPPSAAPTTNGFYFEGGNGYASNGGYSHETTFNSGFRRDKDVDPMATLCQISAQIGPQPRKFDKQYANNLSRIPYSRETLCDLYNQSDARYFSNPDGIDHDLTTHVINFLMDSEEKGSILVFLPGYDDILAIRDRLRDQPCTQTRPEIYTLHSQMNSLDQQRVFEEIKDAGARKVILSTNIAEASLTIDDVIFVIDCGKVKEKMYDHYSRISQLKTVWIAKSNAEQRSGRAGRCRHGYCFRLYSEQEYGTMNDTQIAEMKRAAIHDVCLHAKMFAPESMSVKTFLGMAPEPPSSEAIDNSFAFLQQLGALFAFTNASPFDADVEPPSYSSLRKDIEPDITELGSIIAQLPLEPQLARMLLFGISLQCFNPIVTLVAALSHRDPFILPLGEERQLALSARDCLGGHDLSDHLMLIRAFYAYTDQNTRYREVCKQFYLSAPTMRMIDGIRRQLMLELRRLKLIDQSCRSYDDASINKYSDSWPMVQGAIVAGCYPGIGITRSGSKIKKIRTSIEHATVLHPSSIVKRQLQLSGRRDTYFAEASEPVLEFMAFQELARIEEGTTLRTVSATTPLHTLLFAGSIRVEKIAVQEFEICSEEFPEENLELETNGYQREYCVEVDNFLGFRGYYETVQLAMKLRFKYMNYFMKWLRNPLQRSNHEDEILLDSMNKVLTMELKRLNFREVHDLPKPRIYHDYSRPSIHHQLSNHRNSEHHFNNGSPSSRNHYHQQQPQENGFHQNSSPQIHPQPQQQQQQINGGGHENGGSNSNASVKSEKLELRKRFVISRNDPVAKSFFKEAAAAAKDTVDEVATSDLKNLVRNMQQNSSRNIPSSINSATTINNENTKRIPPSTLNATTKKEPKKEQDKSTAKPAVLPQPQTAAAAIDKSSTTISSSIYTQESTTVSVPSSKPAIAAAANGNEKTILSGNGAIAQPSNSTVTSSSHSSVSSKAYSNDVRNTGLGDARYSRTNRFHENAPYRSNGYSNGNNQQQQNGTNNIHSPFGRARQFVNSNFNRNSNRSHRNSNNEDNKSNKSSSFNSSKGSSNGAFDDRGQRQPQQQSSSSSSSSKPQRFSSSSRNQK